MVLNIWQWPEDLNPAKDMGWDVTSIAGWEELIDFAQRFARRTYSEVPA